MLCMHTQAAILEVTWKNFATWNRFASSTLALLRWLLVKLCAIISQSKHGVIQSLINQNDPSCQELFKNAIKPTYYWLLESNTWYSWNMLANTLNLLALSCITTTKWSIWSINPSIIHFSDTYTYLMTLRTNNGIKWRNICDRTVLLGVRRVVGVTLSDSC